jgi:hypothetical protein
MEEGLLESAGEMEHDHFSSRAPWLRAGEHLVLDDTVELVCTLVVYFASMHVRHRPFGARLG